MNWAKLLRMISVMVLSTVTLSLLVSGQPQHAEDATVQSNSMREPRLLVQAGPPVAVFSVAFSPDDKYVLTGGYERTARLWDIESGREIRRFEGHSSFAWSVAFSPNGKQVLTGSRDGTARLWNIETGEEIRRFEGDSGAIWSVAFSPNGEQILAGSFDGAANLWEVKTGKRLRGFQGSSEGPSGVAFSSDGKRVLLDDGKIMRLWDIETGKEIQKFEGHTASIWSVALSLDDKYALTGSDDQTARLWDVKTGKELRRFEGHTKNIVSVAFSPDSKLALTGSQDGSARVWDVETGKELSRFSEHRTVAGVWSVAFSHSGKYAVTGGFDKTVRVWDVKTAKELRVFEGHAHIVLSARFSKDGKYVLAAGLGSAVSLWEMSTGREIRRFAARNSWSAALSPDGKYVLTGSEDPIAQLWSVETGKELRRFEGHSDGIFRVAFSPDGKYALTGSEDKTARLWNVETGKELRRFEGHSGSINSVAFSPNGRYVLTASNDNTARLWNVDTGSEVRRFEGHSHSVDAVAFSADGQYVLTGSQDRTARLWETETAKEVRRFERDLDHVWAVAFAPNGKYVLTGDDGEKAVLWDVYTGKELRRFEGHSGIVQSVAFSPDGKYVITGGYDSTLRLWELSTSKEFCKLISFTDGNWVVVAQDGRFDASNLDELQGLHWVVPDDPMRPLPLEIFMRDYYEPRLLPRLLDDIPDEKQFNRVRSVASLNRVQPKVKIVDVRLMEGSSDVAQVTIEATKGVAERKRGNPDLDETGVFDIRLFRDSQLVGYWPTPNPQIQASPVSEDSLASRPADAQLQSWRRDAETQLVNGKFTKTFIVKLPHRQDLANVKFTAYAFNRDRIRSALAVATLPLASPLRERKGKAYIVSVGVNVYEINDPDYTLEHAAGDAEAASQQLYKSLKQTGDFEDVVRIKLIADERIKTATKPNIKAVFDVLAGRISIEELKRRIPNAEMVLPDINRLGQANPDDLIIITFATHGENHEGNFFIYPYDTGRELMTREILKHCVSSEELALWLMDVDAGDILMIIDACYSGAVAGEGFKAGPMDSRGLGQLAYDKGMKVLAATQANSLAAEIDINRGSEEISGGLLTLVLIEDGLNLKKAAVNNLITARSWMNYAVAEVPIIYKQLQAALEAKDSSKLVTRGGMQRVKLKRDGWRTVTIAYRATDEKQASITQQPIMFDFTRKQQEVVLARF